ncbi:MAG: DUF4920 domain-containing protein [Bacteroidota bacterium]
MKYSTIFLLLFVVALNAADSKKYGKELTLKEKTKISDILAAPEKYDGKLVQVEGAIVAVCEHRGCWIKISSDKEFESIRFKVEDGVIVFPMEIKGANVVAEGIVSVKTTSKEELIEQGKKHAKEEGTTFDPSTVKGPQTTIQLMGEGAVVTK